MLVSDTWFIGSPVLEMILAPKTLILFEMIKFITYKIWWSILWQLCILQRDDATQSY
jgi:hypothetical protein